MKRIAVFSMCFSVLTSASAEEIVQKLDEIKVTGKRDDVSERRESSTQKVILDRKEIESLSVMTIGEVLGKLPGVEIKGGDPRARGMSRDSVQIMLNGERQAGGGMAATGALSRLPASDLERVEILRGSSAEFGGSAPLTVNLILKKALPKRSTEFKAGLGSRGSEPNYQLSWTENGGSGNFAWSLPISLIWNNSPFTTLIDRQSSIGGTRTSWQDEHVNGMSFLGHHAISPRFTWKSGRDSVTLSPIFFYGPMDRKSHTDLSAYTNPAAGTGLAYNGDRNSDETALNRLLRVRLEGEKHWEDAKLTARTAYSNNRRSLEVARFSHDAANTLTSFHENSVSTDNEINTALRWDQPIDQHLLSIGAEYIKLMRDDIQIFADSTTPTLHNAASRDAIIWLQDDWSVGKSLTLTTGLRVESMGLNADGVSQQHIAWLPSIAARWEPLDSWVMRTSLGAGMKMPKLDEISNTVVRSVSANTPIDADRKGNDHLQPERSINFEAILEHYLPEKAGVLGINFYVRTTRNFTERRMQLEGVRWVDRPYNEGDALHYGVELDGKLRTDKLGWKGATVKAHLTLPYAEVNDVRLGVRRLARETPQYVLSLGLDQSLPILESSYGISAQTSGRSETAIPAEQNGFTAARAVLDAYWLYKLSPKFNLRFAGQNLLAADTRRQNTFQNSANMDANDVRQTGYRNFMVTLEGRW